MTVPADTDTVAAAPPAGTRPAAPRRWLRHGAVSISITLATGIGALVTVAVLSVLALGWAVGTRNTFSLLSDKAELTIALAESRLRDHLDPARDQLSFLAGVIGRGEIDPADRRALLTLLTGAVSATPQIVALGYWSRDLQMAGVERSADGVRIVDRDDSGNPRVADAMAELAAARDPVWGELVFANTERLAALNLRQPVWRDGRMTGVLLAEVSFRELSRFLTHLGDMPAGYHAFILYGHDRVLAHPNLAQGFAGLSPDRPLPTLAEVGDPLLAALWSSAVSGAVESDAVAIRRIDGGGGRAIFLYHPIAGYGPEPLILGAHFPTKDVDGELRRLYWSGIAGLAVLAAAVVLGVLMGRRIARPVRRLAGAAARIGALEFGQVGPLPGSLFRELDNQAHAFNTMLAGLRWFETYVPRSLVKRLIAKGEHQEVRSVERELTVMFTDIAGFTTLAETLPAAETAAFLNRHFALLGACVEAEGGTIDKFIGDALMAFWNAPDRQDDHAERACRAALAIARSIAADNRQRQAEGRPPVRLRIGIHTGPMVVGNIGAPGRMNYTIVGDAVNTGNRVEQLGKEIVAGAPETAILISGATAARLGPAFAPVSCGHVCIRGRQEPIALFRLP